MSKNFYITEKQLVRIVTALEHLDLAQVCRTLCDVKENQFIGNIIDPKTAEVAIVRKSVIAGK